MITTSRTSALLLTAAIVLSGWTLTLGAPAAFVFQH